MYSLPIKFARAVMLCIALLALAPVPADALGVLVAATCSRLMSAQASDGVADLAARINRERSTRGLAPYALNAQLTAAAQAHAQDIGGTGRYGHTGSDGTTATDRAARAGYGKYSWGYRIGENWAHYRDVASAVAMWMESTPHRNNILHALYREFGVGVASAQNGGFIYVVVFGAQPNVLPVFINDGASETNSLNVRLTLSNEEVVPNGDGANTIGRAVEVQISNAADFAGAKWQPFTQQVNWTLSPGSGTKTVYVKYRDAKGRTATANDSIAYGTLATPTPLPTRTITRTPTRLLSPTATPTATTDRRPPTATPTAMPTETLTATPTITADPSTSLRASHQTPTAEIVIAAATIGLPLPTATPEAYPAEPSNPFAQCAFGIAVMLGIGIVVKSLAGRV